MINEILPDTLENTVTTIELYKENTENHFAVLTDIPECPICLTDIEETNAILILDCCKKKVHLACIVEWYSTHPENNLCFMCNQSNPFCEDFVYSNETSESSSQDYSNNPILIEVLPSRTTISLYRRSIIFICFPIFFCLFIFGISYLLVFIFK